MKNVLIFGATGSLATVVIDLLEKQDDVRLTLFARNKQRVANHVNSIVIEGDALNYDAVKTAVKGQDIVYVNLAGNLEAMTKNIVRAMQEMGVKRIIAISSIGIYDVPLKQVLIPYRKLADIIEASGLDYTILRPDWFTNDDKISYALTRKGEPETGTAVSRKSIAAFVASLVEHPYTHVQENLGISKPIN